MKLASILRTFIMTVVFCGLVTLVVVLNVSLKPTHVLSSQILNLENSLRIKSLMIYSKYHLKSKINVVTRSPSRVTKTNVKHPPNVKVDQLNMSHILSQLNKTMPRHRHNIKVDNMDVTNIPSHVNKISDVSKLAAVVDPFGNNLRHSRRSASYSPTDNVHISEKYRNKTKDIFKSTADVDRVGVNRDGFNATTKLNIFNMLSQDNKISLEQRRKRKVFASTVSHLNKTSVFLRTAERTDIFRDKNNSLKMSGVNMANGQTTKTNAIGATQNTSYVRSANVRFTTKNIPSPRPVQCDGCFQHNFDFLLKNEQICGCNRQLSSRISLLILVFTSHSRRLERNSLRKTWLTYSGNNTKSIRYAFLFGFNDVTSALELRKENEAFKDIVQESFIDSYQNLTYKTMMAYKWASVYCACARFVMKVDDDVYLNVPGLLNVAEENSARLDSAIGGACQYTANPIRAKWSKYYVSEQFYPNSTYPGFCSGTGYITKMSVATKVYQVSKDVPFFPLEDVYVSLCLRKLAYNLLNIGGFNADRVTVEPCEYKKLSFVTAHRYQPDEIQTIWNSVCRATSAKTREITNTKLNKLEIMNIH